MSSPVYFIPVCGKDREKVRSAGRFLLETILEKEHLSLEPSLAVKTHFGEKGNRTFLKPDTYDGILDLLEERKISAEFIETCVLYGGQRGRRADHLKLAAEHGFTRLPVEIADGETGEDGTLVEIPGRHFHRCNLGKGYEKFHQLLVLSHFKGHMLAGFGGAIKQLGMGFAAKGGKMAMHMGVKPQIRNWKCIRCKACLPRCRMGALHIGERSWIDHDKCVGCGACYSACLHHAVSIFSFSGFWNALFRGRIFREKLVEYAFAAHRDRANIYFNYALSITRGCDCEPRPMFPAIPDIGIFVSTDPVAVDAACLDAAARAGKKFKGAEQLAYAEKLGMGTRDYTLITLSLP